MDQNEIPEVWYICPETYKKRRYFPDFYFLFENKIVEVKSMWTYKQNFNINIEKKKACIYLGLKFEFWIFDYKGIRTVI